MDPADQGLQAMLVDQAYRHVTMVPHFEGLAVDRLDYTGIPSHARPWAFCVHS
jgi:hypothetical protein